MSGQLIGGVVGAAVGFVVSGFNPAGAKAGWVIGSMIGGIVDPNLPEIEDQYGPRLDDLSVTTSAYGLHIPIIYGSYRISGNVIWSEEIKETKHVEEVEYGKGGSETYEIITYTYSITMAIGLSVGTVSGFGKIWADSVKIYDVHEGGYTQIILDSEESSGNITFYTGSADQDVDWVLQAANQDTPAYRNLCYIVFENFQLQNFGDRIPNITVELISDGEYKQSVNLTYKIPVADTIVIPNTRDNTNINTYLLNSYSSNIQVYSMTERLDPWYNATYDTLYTYNDIINSTIITDDSELYVEILGINYVEIHNTKTGLVAVGPKHGTGYLGKSTYIVKADNIFYAYYKGTTNIALSLYNTTDIAYESKYIYAFLTDLGLSKEIFNTTDYRDLYTLKSGELYTFSTISQDIIKINIDGLNTFFDYTSLGINFINSPNIPLTHSYIRTDTAGNIYIFQWQLDGKPDIYKINNIENIFINKIEGPGSLEPEKQMFSIYNDKYYIYDSTVIDNTYSSLNIYSNMFIKEGVMVSYVLDDILKRAKLTNIDYDISSVSSDILSGYCISRQMSSRSAIEGIQSIYQSLLIEDDYILKVIKIDYNPVLTLLSNDLNEQLHIVRRLNIELPKKLTLRYPNEEIDYQDGSQAVIKMDGSTEYSKILETTVVLTDTKAKQLIEELMFNLWSENVTYTFKLPYTYVNDFKVSDIISIEYNNIIYTMRLTKIVYSSYLECNAISSNTYKVISNAIGSDTSKGFLPYVSQLIGPTELFVFDAPNLNNNYINSLGSYYLASGHTDTWKGCNVLKSINSGVSFNNVNTLTTNNRIGFTTTILNSGPTTVWDLTNTITVKLFNGSLFSSTQYNLIRHADNYIKIGNEILQYTEVLENEDGTYTLSKLLRGRLGTEWAIDTHDINEKFIFLNGSIQIDSNSIGIESTYKAITIGYSSANSVDYIYLGTNVKPLAPANIRFVNNILTWYRRDRYITRGFYNKPYSETNRSLYKINFIDNITIKGTIFIEVTKDETINSYTYDGSFDPIDRIQISQYSSILDDYGYVAEELI